jgi:hypothetical protein
MNELSCRLHPSKIIFLDTRWRLSELFQSLTISFLRPLKSFRSSERYISSFDEEFQIWYKWNDLPDILLFIMIRIIMKEFIVNKLWEEIKVVVERYSCSMKTYDIFCFFLFIFYRHTITRKRIFQRTFLYE